MIVQVTDREREQARELEQLRQEVTAWSITVVNLEAERDALKKSVMQMTNYWLYERGQGGCEPLDSQIVWADALKADAARYQWLLSNAYVGIAPFPKPHEVWCTKLPNPAGCNCLDAAIDAAMKDQS
jgi:hypothetical protein